MDIVSITLSSNGGSFTFGLGGVPIERGGLDGFGLVPTVVSTEDLAMADGSVYRGSKVSEAIRTITTTVPAASDDERNSIREKLLKVAERGLLINVYIRTTKRSTPYMFEAYQSNMSFSDGGIYEPLKITLSLTAPSPTYGDTYMTELETTTSSNTVTLKSEGSAPSSEYEISFDTINMITAPAGIENLNYFYIKTDSSKGELLYAVRIPRASVQSNTPSFLITRSNAGAVIYEVRGVQRVNITKQCYQFGFPPKIENYGTKFDLYMNVLAGANIMVGAKAASYSAKCRNEYWGV